MNIKQAEELSRVSRQNIRFYEREGLLIPERNPENDYREYRAAHILTLKQIRAMRMLDMPLEQIRLVLLGQLSLAEAAKQQEQVLLQKQEQLEIALRFCQECQGIASLEALDVDALLKRMDQPEHADGFFRQWVLDYQKVARSEGKKAFTFVPEEAVTNPREFTAALFAYAASENLDLVVTKEGMYPEFTIGGIEYTAERFYTTMYRVPVAAIRCTAKHPEELEPDVPHRRKAYMKLLNLSWLLIPLLVVALCLFSAGRGTELFSTWEGWYMLLIMPVLLGTGIYRAWLFFYNEKH